MPAKQTFFLEPTSRITKHQYECVRRSSHSCPSDDPWVGKVRSSPWRYGIVQATSPLIPSAPVCQNSLRSFSLLIYRYRPSLSFLHRPNTWPHLLIQDSYQQPIARMLDFFVAAYQENPAATLEVFVHKAESLAEDYKIGTWSYDSQPLFTTIP